MSTFYFRTQCLCKESSSILSKVKFNLILLLIHLNICQIFFDYYTYHYSEIRKIIIYYVSL